MDLTNIYMQPKEMHWSSMYKSITPALNEFFIWRLQKLRRHTNTIDGTLWNVHGIRGTCVIEANSLQDVVTRLSIRPQDGIQYYEIEFWPNRIVIKAYSSILYGVYDNFILRPKAKG